MNDAIAMQDQTPQDPMQALHRADLCRFVAACFYEPTPEFLQAQLFESMRLAAQALDTGLVAPAIRLGQAFAADSLEALRVDHTRLFIGPTRPLAMPYASHWLSDTVEGQHQATDEVLQAYADGGFELDDGFGDLPDHIAVELEFLYALLLPDTPPGEESTSGAIGAREAAAARFVGDHMARWVTRFCAALHAQAQTDFYRTLAVLTEGAIKTAIPRH